MTAIANPRGMMARCEGCRGLGEVLIDGAGNTVWRRDRAVLVIPCPDGCIGGVASCCDGACGGRADVANAPGNNFGNKNR